MLDWQLTKLIQMVDVSLPQMYERVKEETSYPDEAKVSSAGYDDAVDRAELIALALVILSDLG